LTARDATYMVLRSAATVHVAGTVQRVLAGLIVDRCRPLEIGIDLINFPGPMWWISRDLLDLGMAGPAGQMDVHVAPEWLAHTQVLLRASQPGDKDCAILLLRSEIRRALTLSWQLADRETEQEWIDRSVDTVIARCTDKAAS
jgi:hypothetical protein